MIALPVTVQSRSISPDKRSAERAEPGFSAGWRSAGIWSLALFSALNLTFWHFAGEEKAVSKDLWSGAGSIDLAINEFESSKAQPTVVLLGSSLMMFPFFAMDAEMDKKAGDIFHHHRSTVLETALKQTGFNKPNVLSLAIFGQMASDAYIYVDRYLRGGKQPQWLVYGIAPRDFSDGDLPSPTATFTFKRLVGLSNFPRYSALYLPGWQDKTEFICSHACYFYSKRWRLQQEVDKALANVYKKIGLRAVSNPAESKDADAGFMLNGNAQERFQNSLREYRRRYRSIADKDLSVQMGFLDKLLKVCQQRGIKVVLLNMPLTKENIELLPPGFYEKFRNQIQAIAATNSSKLVDLGSSDEFTHADFWDSTHLNHFGGHKLVRHVLAAMQSSISVPQTQEDKMH